MVRRPDRQQSSYQRGHAVNVFFLVLACHSADAPVETDSDTSPPTVITESTDTGSTGIPCVPTPEILGDGIDQACNGWTDELGVGEPISGAGAVVLSAGERATLGISVFAGTVGDGTTWLVASGGESFLARMVVDRAPVDGNADLLIEAPYGAYCYFGDHVAVGNWEAPFVATDLDHGTTRLYSQEGTLDWADDLWSVSRDGIYSFANDLEVADVDLDGEDEMIAGVGARLYVYTHPTSTNGPTTACLSTTISLSMAAISPIRSARSAT